VKVVLIGANGQLGSDVARVLSNGADALVGVTHADLDIRDGEKVRGLLEDARPDVVINTAAMHNVEDCERDPLACFAVNALGARNLALAANAVDAKLLHVSTDYVFDGRKERPYDEQDPPNPLNAYGNSKLAGEIFVRTIARRYFVCRVSALFGTSPCRAKGGMNFPLRMLDLARSRAVVRVVSDETVSPTYAYDAAVQLVRLARIDAYGTYHCAGEGQCTWHEFASAVFELSGTRARLEPAAPGEFPAKVPRPRYSALENAALKRLGMNCMPHWRDALARYLAGLR
jgi:dTDP-4-dehydrorhamnose reductase